MNLGVQTANIQPSVRGVWLGRMISSRTRPAGSTSIMSEVWVLRMRYRPRTRSARVVSNSSILFSSNCSSCLDADKSWVTFTNPFTRPTASFTGVTLTVTKATTVAAVKFRRGDANRDGATNLTDAIALLGYMFLGTSTVPCEQAGGADDSGTLNLTDGVFPLNNLFLGGKEIPAPSAACGTDPTAHSLPCATTAACR